MITYDESIALAHKLRALSRAIRGVELFGSVLWNGYGRDADFMILVDDELAKQWWAKERESIRVRWPDALYQQRSIVKRVMPFLYKKTVQKRRDERLKVSLNMLDIKLEALTDSQGEMPDLEIFLVPVNWRIGTELNIGLMQKISDLTNHRNTLGFMERIARDAVTINF